ncbi:MAG: nucleotidyl transferase AbiEii/AbiGii toxin family protein [Terrimicrobiaceae bacterium]
MLAPRLEILPPAQLALWPETARWADRFVLYGGTAIALRHGHRQSVDFDFFSDQPFDPFAFYAEDSLLQGSDILQTASSTLTCSKSTPLGPVKFSFFGGLRFGRAAAPSVIPDHGLKLASDVDLMVQKLKVIQVRSERKDYEDLCVLLQGGVRLEDGLGAASALYPGFPVSMALRALSYFEGGDVGQLSRPMKKLLSGRAARCSEIPVWIRASATLL